MVTLPSEIVRVVTSISMSRLTSVPLGKVAVSLSPLGPPFG